MKLTKPDIKITPPSDDDLRIGHYISDSSSKPRFHFIGFCVDEGVKRNGGRPGAALAPDEIRRQFWKMTPDPANAKAFSSVISKIKDHGNFHIEDDNLEDAQLLLGKWVNDILSTGSIPIILGGGHETAYGHFLGYSEQNTKINILNWDAHADVRPLKNGKAHSGSPFYQILENHTDTCNQYIVAGLQRHSLSATHLKYLQQKKCAYFFKGEIIKHIVDNIYDRLKHQTMVTMDMDALDQRIAPGVSAPNVNGFMLDTWLHCAYCAGKSSHVSSLDIVEFNPQFDRDHQTARVAALTLWHFFQGFTQRIKS